MKVKVSRKHQIAVPASVRRQLHIHAGDQLEVRVEGETIVLRQVLVDPVAALLTVAPELWQGLDADSYINTLRDEWSASELSSDA